ncbi:Spy/CpxP family protein refolding chaperone [Legionella sp. WA2024007413]
MNVKRFLLINSLAFSVLSTSIAIAQPAASGATVSINHTGHYKQHVGKLLTPEQRSELAKIKNTFRTQMAPLIKEKRALSMQIKGKLASPNAKWSDISSLVEKRNRVNAKISTLWAQTQFQTYQKLGVLLPVHHSHHCGFQNKNLIKRS